MPLFLAVKSVKDFVILDQTQFRSGHRFQVIPIRPKPLDLFQQGLILFLQVANPLNVGLSILFHPIQVDEAAFSESEPGSHQSQED